MKFFAVGAVAVATLAGCSEDEPVAGAPVAAAQAAGQGTGAKVCALLEAAEVEAVFGGATKAPEPTDGPIVANCGYKAEGAAFYLATSLADYQGKTAGQFDEQKAYYKATDAVGGLGDTAFSVTSGHETVVTFRQGEKLGSIAKVYTGSRDESKVASDTEAMIELARKMSGRL